MKNRPFLQRLVFAIDGIGSALRHEASFRTQAICAFLSISAFTLFKAPPIWWAFWTLCVGSVLAAELINTALENLLDHLHPDIHPQIKIAKDCAAGAVLMMSVSSVIVFICFLVEQFN